MVNIKNTIFTLSNDNILYAFSISYYEIEYCSENVDTHKLNFEQIVSNQ